MAPKTAVTPQPHMGRKIERVRTIKGIKQSDLAQRLGIAQSALSAIENSERVDEDKLQKIADALEMSVEALKNFNEEAVINNIQNNYNYEGSNSHNSHHDIDGNNGDYGTYNFNPIEKVLEVLDENKKLYERMLESERRNNESLEALL